MNQNFQIRMAVEDDIPLILSLIRELAAYEHLEHEVVATGEILREWVFQKRTAQVLIAEEDGVGVGYALFFHNFSTFLGRAGVYLEDLFIQPAHRGKGYGKTLLKHLASLTAELGGGRLEWSCLDWNQPSIEFYRSIGAIPMEGWTVYRLTGKTLEEAAR